MEDVQCMINWEDVVCPICLDFPHNGVLLQCSSYEKGCRPFVCHTDHLHSNCLDRFKTANGMSSDHSRCRAAAHHRMAMDSLAWHWIFVHGSFWSLYWRHKTIEHSICLMV